MLYNRPTQQQMKNDIERAFVGETPKQLYPNTEFAGYA
jgi:hypothetical protein